LLRDKSTPTESLGMLGALFSIVSILSAQSNYLTHLKRATRTIATFAIVALLLGLMLTQAFQPTGAHAETNPAITARSAGIETDGDQAHLYVTNGPDKATILTLPAATLDARTSDSVSVSPDGQKVVYMTAGQADYTGSAIWSLNYDGSDRQMLANFSTQKLWTAPFTWSHDSRQLAYVIMAADGSLELWRMNADGTGQQPVLKNSSSFRQEIFFGDNRNVLSWTPDGKYLEYTDRSTEPYRKFSVDLTTDKVSSVEVPSDKTQTPRKLDVPLFSQMDPRWQSWSLGVCGTTIGAQGCALTSTAMVFKYFGVDTDPARLRNCLGYAACPMHWSEAANNCSGGKVSGGDILSFDFDAMRNSLDHGFPVIVGFMVNTARTHFVVVNGGSGTDPNGYTVNDPWDATNTKTLGEFIQRQGWPQQMELFTGTPPTPHTPGEGTSRLAQFVDAYNRGGGLTALGSPTNGAHWWYGAVIQDFPGDPVAIMQDEDSENRQGLTPGTCLAYYIRRGIFNWYAANGNPTLFGPPTSDEFAWNNHTIQSFDNGYIQFGNPANNESTGFTAWPATGDGWRREFYNNKSWGCGTSWVDYLGGDVNLDSPWDASGPVPALVKDGWSARYTRTISLSSGSYTITASSANGVKVWLDDNLVVNVADASGGGWQGHVTGVSHTLKIEFTGGDQAQLNFKLAAS